MTFGKDFIVRAANYKINVNILLKIHKIIFNSIWNKKKDTSFYLINLNYRNKINIIRKNYVNKNITQMSCNNDSCEVLT